MGAFHSTDADTSTTLDESPFPVNIMTEETDEEIEAGLEERRRILADCDMLKNYAGFHLHPERPVAQTEDPTACARCYFNRASAPQQESIDDMQEHIHVMEECVAMRTYADFFLHPERPVVTTDPTAFGRNYFSRPSAIPQICKEEADEQVRALEDALIFQQFAAFHLHPERRVITTDPTSFGRNYFGRASAIPQESYEDVKERDIALNNVEKLKTAARFHMHPELPVKTTDPMACGRNYYNRPSAVEPETLEEMEERNAVMDDVIALKLHAKFHLHPELPVKTTDPSACARCYFDRVSAPEGQTKEDMEERDQILHEVEALKMYAKFHMHPEFPIETTDPFACARDYFDRASGPEAETPEQIREKEQILRDAAQLEDTVQLFHTGHSLEQDYFHDFAAAVNDAPEMESSEDSEERKRVLEDAAQLEMYAKFHLHPELPVTSTDPFACERNFFDRVSAPEQESPAQAEERHEIFQDLKYLEDCAQILHNGHTLDHDYFHGAHFMMDEDMHHDESEEPATSDKEGDTAGMKTQEEGRLSRSPSSIFEFA